MTAIEATDDDGKERTAHFDDDDLRILVEKCQQLREAHLLAMTTYGEIESLLRSMRE